LDVVLIAVALILAGLALAAVWMRLGVPVLRRFCHSIAIGAVAALVIFGCTKMRTSWDNSESRGNSFPVADERALQQIREPLRIEVHLAPEDPRRVDLEHHALGKLRRIMPDLHVTYVSSTSIGLFEQTSEGYGEIRYDLAGRKAASRVTTEEGVLEEIYSLAGVTPPKENDEAVFRGHPLAVQTKGAGVLFFGVWPALVLAGAFLVKWRLL
jgi:hypothetical protein